jgi:hypothetical protein
LDFKDTIDTVKAIVTRLNSPVSDFNLVFSETDSSVEVRVETSRSLEPIFVFIVDAERFRVVKDTVLNPAGYSSYTYSGCVELLSYIFECFYPIFNHINHGVSIMEMLTRVFGENIRIWKDLIRVICKAGNIEFFDFGDVVSLLETNFSYNLDSYDFKVSGKFEEEIKCRSVMELVTAILMMLDYLFKREELEINPILEDRLVDEGEDDFGFDEMEDTMNLGDEIESGGLDMGGEDLSAEFEPSEEGVENFAPDVETGKEELLDDAT